MLEEPKSYIKILQRIVDIKQEEVRVLIWSSAYFFCILSAYYIIRPLREEMGVAGGVWNIPWLMTGTLIAMLVVHPPFAWLVSKYPRRKFVTITYRFFMANLLIFFALLKVSTEAQNIWIGRIFYIWTAVFSLFIVSIFWGFMADIFRIGQGKRLFGFIGVGGTLGGIVGSGITAALAVKLGPVHLLLISVVLLEAGVQSARRLSKIAEDMKGEIDELTGRGIVEPPEQTLRLEEVGQEPEPAAEVPIGGGVLDGIRHLVRSPYLLGIAVYMLLFTILSTVLYMQQAGIVERTFIDRAVRTAVFAEIDLAVNVLTLLTQFYLTGRIIKALGIGLTLTLVPIISIIGFTGLGLWPTFAIFFVFQVMRRAGNYAVSRPARETLYTVVSREDKYKAKNFIDTFVYRSGDWISAQAQLVLHLLGLSMVAIAFTAVPIAGLWLVVGLWLGRKQKVINSAP